MLSKNNLSQEQNRSDLVEEASTISLPYFSVNAIRLLLADCLMKFKCFIPSRCRINLAVQRPHRRFLAMLRTIGITTVGITSGRRGMESLRFRPLFGRKWSKHQRKELHHDLVSTLSQ